MKKITIGIIALIAVGLLWKMPIKTTEAFSHKQFTAYGIRSPKLSDYEVPEVESVDVQITKTSILSDDVLYLAKVLDAEAGNQGTYGMTLVCDVVLNRVDNEKFPNTIQDVIRQDGQFETLPLLDNIEPSDNAIEVVLKELENRTNNEVLYFRTGHYHEFANDLFQYRAHYFSN